MKPRLIILSDLWGKQRSSWLKGYYDALNAIFELQYYDCCELGNIDLTDYSVTAIHTQFVNRGIDIAVDNLLKKESKKINILAFSVGGTIAWKAILKGLAVENFYAISATRLRYETNSPSSKIKLYFGTEDSYRPSQEWFDKIKINYTLVEGKGHTIYSDPEEIKTICQEILKTF